MATQHTESHVLPAWFIWIQRHAALGGLLIAQFLITTAMILKVSVSDPANWQQWSWLDWVNVATAGMIGLAAAGVALGLSESMAQAWGAGKWITGLFTLLGMGVLVSFDVWSGIAERSQEARPTPADSLLAHWTGITAFGVVPISVVFISVLHAALLLFYGWSNRPQVVETVEERSARQARELSEAAHKAKLAEYQGAGWGARLGAGFKAAKQQVTGEQSGGNDSDEPADNVTPFPPLAGDESGGFGARSANSTPGAKNIRKGQWTSGNLREYALSTYGANVSADAAQSAMSALAIMGKAHKEGNRYVASQKTVKAWVDQKYGETQATGTGER